ncbi:MAG: 2Fe-2S iron-sulfur cluster binding domain-containing protein [Rhodospirillales bacterium]|nr:2Fe-2S iron-sulfur cluster binding domain-containing protein [Rhodospirillales bacterium]
MSEPIDNPGHWKGTRTFVVDRKEVESQTVTSFYLRPEDGGPMAAYKPGQFLTFQLNIPGLDKQVVRSYTLSDSPGGLEDGKLYRLSIKREPSPRGMPDVPPGASSNYFHDHVGVGSTLQVIAPTGDFFLADGDGPVVLLSGGVGLTPMISMLNHLVDQGAARPVWFVHGVQNGTEHAFGPHVRQLAETHASVRAHVVYVEPGPGDVKGRDFDDAGFITIEMLERIGAGLGADYYLCGPPPFMQALYTALRDWGVDDTRIFYEFFGPATVLKGAPGDIPANPAPHGTQAASGIEVTFKWAEVTVPWDGTSDTLLELAEAHGVDADFSCRSGVCHTCACTLMEGEIEYINDDVFEPDEADQVLICSAIPKTNIVLDS